MTLYHEQMSEDSHLLTKFCSTYRYSTTFCINRESISDHSSQLSLLILLMYSEYTFIRNNTNLRSLLVRATLHDLPEIVSGDVVSPIKKYNKQIEKCFDKIEEVSIDVLCTDRSSEFKNMLEAEDSYALTEFEKSFFKFLDVYVVFLKAEFELSLGNNHFLRVRQETIPEIISKFNKISITRSFPSLNVELLGFVNKYILSKIPEVKYENRKLYNKS